MKCLARRGGVTRAKLSGKVERISRGVAYLSFKGAISGEPVWQFAPHKGKKISSYVTLRGVGTTESKTGKLLTLVGDGRFRN